MLHLLYEPTAMALATAHLGDVDLDANADQHDVTRLARDILSSEYGDANLDRSVDLADFNIWLTENIPVSPHLTPDPATAPLLGVAWLAVIGIRANRWPRRPSRSASGRHRRAWAGRR